MKICLLFATVVALCCHGCLPPADPYPNQAPAQVVARAQAWSDSFQTYIYQWTRGQASASIPASLIPRGISDSRNFYLKAADAATAAETWAVRYAKPINKDSLYAGIPDPKVTYLFLGTALAPFGSKLVLEGEFPHCRFFSVQVSPPLNGKEYYAQRQFGTAEVSVADADIQPLPGHTNPFVLGANRNATNRSYRLEFDLTTGDPTTLNGAAHTYPYRQASNNRKGAMLVYQGPLGHKTVAGTALPTPGDWDLGCLWIRIYEPDENTNALGGVPMPKAYFVLPTGGKYFVGSDFSTLQKRADLTIKNRVTADAPHATVGPEVGWFKSWGITRSMLNGVSQVRGWSRQDSGARIRAIDLGWTGRGEAQPPPGNIEPHATTNNYATYLGRSMAVPPGMVAVLTGRLPTFPATRNGEPVMTGGQVRYWSVVGIDDDPLSPMPATTIHAVSDDDVLIDADRNYVIAYSRPGDRPANARKASGVTWVDWGTQSRMGLLMRWVNIAPDWRFSIAPQEHNLDFAHSDWAATRYDSLLIGVNWRNGFLQCYLPRVHYLTKAQFEALGNQVKAASVPVWLNESYTNGAADSRLGKLTASSVLDATAANRADNANDGDVRTAWSSAFGQNTATLTLDLGKVKTVSGIKLLWDYILFAKDYTVTASEDGRRFIPLINATNANGNVDLFASLPLTKARYLRLQTTKVNVWYARLAEFEVYTTDCDCGRSTTRADSTARSAAGLRLQVFPNPAGSNRVQYQIDGAKTSGPFRLQLLNEKGNRLRQWVRSATIDTVDISSLPPGVYVLVAEEGSLKGSVKFVKAV